MSAVSKVDPGRQALVDLASCFVRPGGSDVSAVTATTKRHGAHGEDGDPETGSAQSAVFHHPTLSIACLTSTGPVWPSPRPHASALAGVNLM
jgi:hypothetical protein